MRERGYCLTDWLHATPLAAVAATVVAALVTTACGGAGSPGAPTIAMATVSGVTLAATTLAVGRSGEGTITLSASAPSGGVGVALSSSNPAVASVQPSLTIAGGSSSATFAVVGVATGTTAITASLNGNTSQSPLITVIPRAVALSSISMSAPNIIGGSTVTGVVTLTGPAPAGGADVSLSAADPVTVPTSVVVPAGSSTATFSASTRTVDAAVTGTITGAYGGVTASATVSIVRPGFATASFGVSGSTETDTCTMTTNGRTLNCTFDGSTSTAPGAIVAWDWSYRVAATFAQTTSGPVLSAPAVDCSLLPPPPLPPGTSWFTMTVTLIVHDSLGNVSAMVTSAGVRLLPGGACGF